MAAAETSAQVSLAKRELRFVTDGYTKWRKEIQPQPAFGESLSAWMESRGQNATQLADALKCGPATVRKWLDGNVPSKEFRAKLVELGFTGDFHPLRWSQNMFVGSELVEMKNARWVEGMDPKRQTIQKYLIRCRMPKIKAEGRGKNRTITTTWEETDVLFGTRVTDVAGIISKGDALTDWTVCQGFAELIGEPVLHGTAYIDGVLSKVEIRGTWRKLKAWERKCVSSNIVLDQSRARIANWSLYSKGDLLDFHREAFNAKYRKRDEAGELGTRAHKLGQAWIKYHAIQDRDPNGLPTIDRIRAPKHFWNSETTSEEIDDFWLGHERPEVQNALKALQTFWIANRLTVVSTEELLADLDEGVAGAVDCVVRDKHGDLLILDWKTANGIYTSMMIQVTWYARLWSLCKGEMPDRAYIVRLDKLTAAVQVVPVFETPEKREKRFRTAMHAINLLRDNEEMENELSDYGPED